LIDWWDKKWINNIYLWSFGQVLDESLVDGLDEVSGVQIWASWDAVGSVHTNSQILGHLSVFDGFDGTGLEGVAELGEFWQVIEGSSV